MPGEFHEQRSLTGYRPWACKESDRTEPLTHTLHPALLGTSLIATSVATERWTWSPFPHRTLASPPASSSSFPSFSGTCVTKRLSEPRAVTRSRKEESGREPSARVSTEPGRQGDSALWKTPGWPLTSDLPVLLPHAQNQSSSVCIQSWHCSLDSVSDCLFLTQDKLNLHGLQCSCDQSLPAPSTLVLSTTAILNFYQLLSLCPGGSLGEESSPTPSCSSHLLAYRF